MSAPDVVCWYIIQFTFPKGEEPVRARLQRNKWCFFE